MTLLSNVKSKWKISLDFLWPSQKTSTLHLSLSERLRRHLNFFKKKLFLLCIILYLTLHQTKYGSCTKLTHSMPCPTRFLTWVKFLNIYSTKWGQSHLEILLWSYNSVILLVGFLVSPIRITIIGPQVFI